MLNNHYDPSSSPQTPLLISHDLINLLNLCGPCYMSIFVLLSDLLVPFFSTLSKDPMGFFLTIDWLNNLMDQRPSEVHLVLPTPTTIKKYEAISPSTLPPTHSP